LSFYHSKNTTNQSPIYFEANNQHTVDGGLFSIYMNGE